MTTGYSPGVCNIGPQEIANRRTFGWVSLAVVVALLAVLAWTKTGPFWRLLVFFPAAAAAIGFLQAHFHFCVGFARQGVYNFGPLGQVTTIEDEASKKEDRRRGMLITLLAAVIGAAIAAVSVFVF